MTGGWRAHSAALPHRELQHRPVEPGVADRELGGMHADREPAGAGVEIVARERALAAGVELAAGIERERMRRDHGALAQRRQARAAASPASAIPSFVDAPGRSLTG